MFVFFFYKRKPMLIESHRKPHEAPSIWGCMGRRIKQEAYSAFQRAFNPFHFDGRQRLQGKD